MASVVYEDVSKVYPDGTPAVSNFNLEVRDEEFMILVGPSGCGKSTALRMVAGLESITSGRVHIGDRVVNELPPKERDIAMVFQSYALYPHKSVADNMGFALRLAKVPDTHIQRRVADAAEILGLTDLLHRKPKALSGGQRQRVAMGRAIVRSPQTFLMDEPLSNLDAKLRVQMRAEISSLQSRLAVTTLYVTHDQTEAMTMGDRVAVLKRGELMQVDAPQKLYDHPDNLFVAGFIGSPAMNIARATLRRVDGDTWVELEDGTSRLRVPDAAFDLYPAARRMDGMAVAVGLRPEHFVRPRTVNPDQVWTQRVVTLVEMLGAEMLVHFDTDATPIVTDDMRQAVDDEAAFTELMRQATAGGQTFTARLDPGSPPKIGEKIDVGFRTDRLHFFDIESGAALR